MAQQPSEPTVLPTIAANMTAGKQGLGPSIQASNIPDQPLFPIPLAQPIGLALFWGIEAAVRAAGHGEAIDWSEDVQPPRTATQLASAAIYVIANSGLRNNVATAIYRLVMTTLKRGGSAGLVFGHPGKAPAMDWLWTNRKAVWMSYKRTPDVLEWCGSLPWIGDVTKYHLAKNLGADVAKPDVHLERLARAEGTDTHALCRRLSEESGLRVATVDTILWRACAEGIIDSRSVRAKRPTKPKSKPIVSDPPAPGESGGSGAQIGDR